ncbi:hypothetical protein EON67_11820, partial [archaeon]
MLCDVHARLAGALIGLSAARVRARAAHHPSIVCLACLTPHRTAPHPHAEQRAWAHVRARGFADSPAAASLPTAPEPSAASETAQRVEIVVQTNNGKVERVTRRFGRGTRRVLLGVKERAAWETFTDPRHASVDEEILSVDFVLPEVINAAGEDEEEDDHTVVCLRLHACVHTHVRVCMCVSLLM